MSNYSNGCREQVCGQFADALGYSPDDDDFTRMMEALAYNGQSTASFIAAIGAGKSAQQVAQTQQAPQTM